MFYAVEHIPSAETMQAVVNDLLPLVPFPRREKALRYKHLHGQYTCLRTWQMLYELLLTHGFLPEGLPLSALTYTEDEYGKPWLDIPVKESVCFSLSHTKNAVAVAIDSRQVGIDIEAIVSAERIADRHFMERTMSVEEQQAIHVATDPRMAFTELWTRKEALVKAIGTGINMDTLPHLLQSNTQYRLQSVNSEAYACSIAMLV